MKLRVFLAFALLLAGHCSQAKLLISEVLYDTPGSDKREEWVELFNSGCETINLNQYTLSDNSKTHYLKGQIASGEYITIAKDAQGFNTLYQTTPNYDGLILSLGNKGDLIELKTAGITVDYVAWENGLSGWTIKARHHSIYRQSSAAANTPSNWAVSTVDSPGSGSLSTNCSNAANSTPQSIGYAQYYSGTAGLRGTELKKTLQRIISKGYKRLTYKDIWSALQYTDEDPGNKDNVILLYTGRSHDKNDRDGQPGSDNNSWNREHVWPKSLGFPNKGQYGYTDIHHIRPADKSVNSARGAKDFDNGGRVQSEAPDTFYDNDSWEPRDAIKGDIARMMFYMDTRYNGMDNNMPDLSLVNHTNSSTSDAELGVLCTLFDWHIKDPVDAFERRRNDRIYAVQKNRNPFIDNPQWVKLIWDAQCS